MDPTVKAEPTTVAPTDTANMNLGTESKSTPSTPQKRNRTKQMPADSDPDGQESPTKKNKTKSPAKKIGPLGPIPTNYDEASGADRMLLRMKDSENRSWAEIGKALEGMIGASLKLNTVQVRYARMKANLVGFEKTDEPILLKLKKEIEDRFEVEKWQKIADGITATSGNKYSSATVQKRYKELAKNGNGVVAMEE